MIVSEIKEPNKINDVYEQIRNSSTSDYDGHTEFNRMTHEQKLMWLSQSAQFYWMVNKQSENKKK